MFPGASHLALSATCTPPNIKCIVQILQYDNPAVIKVNPDRPNIYLEVKKRLPNNRKHEKWDEIFAPLASQLLLELNAFPLTIVYMESLEALGYAYQYFSYTLKEKQYIPVDEQFPENRIFAQFHTDYTPEMKHHIVMELRKRCPKIRVILATVALGMGLDAPSISRVIHCRPPTTLENYLQEFGRAGRNGQKASALLYYNNSDIASNRKGISQAMVDYCKNSTACFRLLIVNHFGFQNVVFSGSPLDCCSHCASWNDELIK